LQEHFHLERRAISPYAKSSAATLSSLSEAPEPKRMVQNWQQKNAALNGGEKLVAIHKENGKWLTQTPLGLPGA
jgi:hypothetical protein